MNVTVACLRGQRRRAADAYITGTRCCARVPGALCDAGHLCDVAPSLCTQKREPGTDVAVVPDGHQALRRQLLPRGGKTRTRRGLSFSSASLAAGFRSSRRLQGEARLRRCCFDLRRTKRRLIPCMTTPTGVLPRASSPEFQSRQAEPSFATSEVLC